MHDTIGLIAGPMSDLKKLYTAKGPGDAHVLRGLLESEGIDVAIRGDDFVPLQGGGLFHVETRPSIWVLDDERYARAQEMAAEYARQGSHADAPVDGSGAETWTCPSCREPVEGAVHGLLELWPRPDAVRPRGAEVHARANQRRPSHR